MTDADLAVERLRRIIEIIRNGVVAPKRITYAYSPFAIGFQWSTRNLGFHAHLSFDSQKRRYSLRLNYGIDFETITFDSAELGDLVAQRYLTLEERAADLATAIEGSRS